MNYLLVDTSGAHLSVVVKFGGKTEYIYKPDCGVNHSVEITAAIEQTLEKAGATLLASDFFGAVVGAGSFTGIRIGVSAVKGLCLATGKTALKITSFDTIAYNKDSGKVMAVIDAGHNGYYVCGYENKKEIISPRFVLGEELKNISEDFTLLSYGEIKGLKTKVVSPLNGLIKFAEENGDKITDDINDLTPLYCRKSQAEEGR